MCKIQKNDHTRCEFRSSPSFWFFENTSFDRVRTWKNQSERADNRAGSELVTPLPNKVPHSSPQIIESMSLNIFQYTSGARAWGMRSAEKMLIFVFNATTHTYIIFPFLAHCVASYYIQGIHQTWDQIYVHIHISTTILKRLAANLRQIFPSNEFFE